MSEKTPRTDEWQKANVHSRPIDGFEAGFNKGIENGAIFARQLERELDEERDLTRRQLAQNQAMCERFMKAERELAEEREGHAFDLTPEMVQARNDQLANENEALKAELAELRNRQIRFVDGKRDCSTCADKDTSDESYPCDVCVGVHGVWSHWHSDKPEAHEEARL